MRGRGRVKVFPGVRVPLSVISIICLFENYQRNISISPGLITSPLTRARLHPARLKIFCVQEEDCGVPARQPAGHQSGGECGQWGVLMPGQRPGQGRPDPPRQRQR